jgi:hypothetical protein
LIDAGKSKIGVNSRNRKKMMHEVSPEHIAEAEKRALLSHQHGETTEKLGKAMQAQAGQRDRGKLIAEYGKAVQEHSQAIRQHTRMAREDDENATEEYIQAGYEHVQQTQEQIKAVKEYSKYMQQQIEESKQALGKNDSIDELLNS